MKIRRHIIAAGLAAPILVSAVFAAAPAGAAVVNLDTGLGGAWTEFVFEPAGQSWDDEFHFHLDTEGLLEVTDGYQQGDIFDVVANGTDLGTTSYTPPDPNVQFLNNFENAYNSTLMSHSAWFLNPGDYVITGSATVTPFGFAGGAGIRVEALGFGGPTDPIDPTGPVSGAPEPAAWALMILGFGGAGVLLRRRRERAGLGHRLTARPCAPPHARRGNPSLVVSAGPPSRPSAPCRGGADFRRRLRHGARLDLARRPRSAGRRQSRARPAWRRRRMTRPRRASANAPSCCA